MNFAEKQKQIPDEFKELAKEFSDKGFITTSFLFPKYVSTEVIGLFGVIVAYSTIASHLSSLGIKGVTGRLFPYFRNESNGHNGFLFIGVSVVLIGFVLFLAVFSIISPYLLEGKADSVLLIDHFFYNPSL